jgi:hypothetical protein
VADQNAAAQDKALDALLAFLARASEQQVTRCGILRAMKSSCMDS